MMIRVAYGSTELKRIPKNGLSFSAVYSFLNSVHRQPTITSIASDCEGNECEMKLFAVNPPFHSTFVKLVIKGKPYHYTAEGVGAVRALISGMEAAGFYMDHAQGNVTDYPLIDTISQLTLAACRSVTPAKYLYSVTT